MPVWALCCVYPFPLHFLTNRLRLGSLRLEPAEVTGTRLDDKGTYERSCTGLSQYYTWSVGEAGCMYRRQAAAEPQRRYIVYTSRQCPALVLIRQTVLDSVNLLAHDSTTLRHIGLATFVSLESVVTASKRVPGVLRFRSHPLSQPCSSSRPETDRARLRQSIAVLFSFLHNVTTLNQIVLLSQPQSDVDLRINVRGVFVGAKVGKSPAYPSSEGAAH